MFFQFRFFCGAQEGDQKTVQTMLEADSEVAFKTNDKQETPLFVACFAGHTEIVSTLLESVGEKSKDYVNQVNSDGVSSLYNAARNGHVDIVESLISKGKFRTKVAKVSLCAFTRNW